MTLEQVKASAGSGKTYALTSTYLQLLRGAGSEYPERLLRPSSGYAWPDIMAVTFTVKAAAEMKDRVLKALKERALGLQAGPAADWSPEEAGARLKSVIRRYACLNIRTLDSFRGLLIQAAAPELELPPSYKTIFDWDEVFSDLFDRLNQYAQSGIEPARRLLERAGLAFPTPSGFMPVRRFRQALLNVFKFRVEHSEGKFIDFLPSDEDLPEDLLSEARSLLPLLELSDHMLAMLDEYRQSRAEIPIWSWDILLARVFALLDAPELFCRLGLEMKHLLIDEFQDTSDAQWRSIAPLACECLANGGLVFMVGDVKQAIYGWRGGNAGLFEEVLNDPEIMAPAGRVLCRNLACNHRSAESIVNFNNNFFSFFADPEAAYTAASALLPEDVSEATARKLGAKISAAFAGAGQKKAGAAGLTGFVSFRLIEGATKDAVQQLALRWMLDTLRDDLLKRYANKEVTVLVRSNEEAALVAAQLMRAGLPVLTENSLLLAEHPLIRQIISFLNFLDYPYDNLAFWEFISGRELFGAVIEKPSLDELYDWLAAESTGGYLFRRFQADFPEIWQSVIAPFYNHSGLMNPYDLVSEILARYKVWTHAPQAEAFLRCFLEVLHNSEEQGYSSISAFLEFWRDKGAQEQIHAPEQADAIKVMTIHKAKGLEFPVVLMPFHLFPASRPPELTVYESSDGCALAPCRKELGALYYEQLLPQVLEQLNLLYVAWTRPSRELHACLTMAASRRKNEFQGFLRQAFRRFKLEKDGDNFEIGSRESSDRHQSASVSESPVALEDHAAPIDQAYYDRRENDPERPMSWLPRLRIFRNRFQADSFAKGRGVRIHRALELLRFSGDPSSDARRAALQSAAALPEEERSQAVIDVCDKLEWFLGLPDAGLWLRKGRREQLIVDVEGRRFRTDLLVETDQATWVIDYKTGRSAPEHIPQIRNYLRLLSARRSDSKPVRGLLVYLDEKRCEAVD